MRDLRAVLGISSNTTSFQEDLAVEYAQWGATRRPTWRNVVRQLISASRFELPNALPIPLLVLSSMGDRLVSHRCSEAVASALRATLRLHESAGHDLPLDAPRWTCLEIARWMEATGTRRRAGS